MNVLSPYLSGFALGFSLILAIGAQNAFVLRQGLRGEHVFAVALVCALSDAILIALGVAGMGAAISALPALELAMRWAGALFLFAYGALRLGSAWRGGEQLAPSSEAPPARLGAVLATCLAFTWLNPHVWLDTVLLIGSVAARWPAQRDLFGLGAVSASFVFFFGLAYGARLLRPLFARPSAWRVLDVLIALVMWALALGLIWPNAPDPAASALVGR